MHKYSGKGGSLEQETGSVILEFEDTSFYSCVSKAKCFIVAICSVVALILASVSYSLLNSDIALVNQTFNNWQQSPIEDLAVVSSGHTCPSGYETAWTDSKWLGTRGGCYCPYSFFDKVSGGTCDKKERKRGCHSIWSNGAMSFENFDGYLLCAKRSLQIPSVMTSPTTTNNKDCDFGFKACGASSDQPAERICIDESLSCPVNRVLVGSAAQVAGFDKILDISPEKKLGISYNHTGLPVVQFKISPGLPCIDSSDDNRASNKRYHELENKGSGCDKYGDFTVDSRWDDVDNVTEYKLYNENGIMSKIAALPESDTSVQAHSNLWHLYSREYIEWNPTCTANGKLITRQRIANDSKNLSDSVKDYQVWIVVISVFFVCFGILTLIIACCRKCAPFSQIFMLIIKAVVIVFCAIMCVLYFKSNSVIVENEGPFSNLMLSGCSDR